MGILADADAVGSQLLATIGAAAIIALCALAWRIWRALSRLIVHVLPHFEPPTAAEIREGVQDNTIPARMARVEEKQDATAAELSNHLVEETAAGVELAATLARGTDRMDALEAGQASIAGKLDDTLDRLAAGNPEVRPG